MKKILFSSGLVLPAVALAQVGSEAFAGADVAGYSPSPVWGIFGWLMLLCLLVWIVVGLLLSIWLWKNIKK